MASVMTYSTLPPDPPDLSDGIGANAKLGQRPVDPRGGCRRQPGPLTQPVSIDAIISLENWTTQAHTIPLDTSGRLKVVLTGAGKYVCELRRGGLAQQVKFSAPIYLPEEAARSYGNDIRNNHLARLAAKLA
jgi:hypothetical protein